MRTFAHKPKETKQTTSAKSTIAGRGRSGQCHEVNSYFHLQRTIGNQAVQRMLQTHEEELNAGSSGASTPRFGHVFCRIPMHSRAAGALQTKPAVNNPRDSYEQEADPAADQVMRMQEPRLQRICACGGDCPKCQTEQSEHTHERLQIERIATDNPRHSEVPPIVHEVLRSPGQPVDVATRAFMEPRFGHDFSRVRVHADDQAAKSARAVSALAFTVGSDVVFGTGQYLPGTSGGRRLLAHELTHVVQQASNPTHETSALRIDAADSSVEREAERVGEAVSKAEANPGSVSLHVDSPVIARAPRPKNGTRRRDGRAARAHAEQPAGRGRSLVSMDVDTAPARIDNSMTVDQITNEFYRIPIELIPPGTLIPAGPILTIGSYGCGMRRYGLTGDEFSLTLDFDDADVRSQSHPFNIVGESGMQTVQCWTDHVGFRARIRNTIWLPSDLATHPCLRGEDPGHFSTETLAHERLHEADNNAAAEETMGRLRERLAFTPGVGSMMAMVRITDDPASFVEECKERLRATLERLRDEHEIVYRRISAESAIKLDPHDRALHELKLRLLQEARARSAAPE